MPNPMQIPLFLCALLTTATGALAQKPDGRSDARADSRADASGKSSDSSHSSHTSTHKVVVVNGKTIVDERTEDGRPAPSGGAAGGALPGGVPMPGGLPSLPEFDPEEMLKKLREQVEHEVGGAMPPLPLDGKWIDVRDGKHSASDSAKDSSASSSSSKDADHKGADHKSTGAKSTDAKTTDKKPTRTPDAATKDAPSKPTAEQPATEGGKLTPQKK